MSALLRIFGAPAILFARTLTAIRRDGVNGRATMVQLVEIGSKSSLLIVSGLAFFGAVMVTIAWAQARKYTGNITVVGPAYFELMVPLAIMDPNIFCRCVGLKGDVVSYAKLDWDGVDDLEDGGIVVGLK